ncbi:bifunctional 3-(3-hydroxy-phenyl)propionate/3-hydroxycinnamic acid hydroxylase [Streptomyces sp. NBC_00554]|uniref:bifunctional 3-(3-hydroxy-phenyl)propionate/3-hydroxycinnamic acid hydroxylase n=1 Tax=Streptomyces sp. NBC_00554 TaxID=2903661 RepID=UPI00352BDC30|nr:bifunctional 3-(3-hydroxy-phenyl)propionate/3-hydroxycinnamic acid hydroxylase [Streptomyces sp. NBC_00554]
MTPPGDADVLVVGAGPCGMTLANLLGVYGVSCIVIDRDTEVLNFPRAVGIDDESLRSYQAAGLVDDVLEDVIQNTAIRYYTSWGRLLAHVSPSGRPFGWPRRNLFLQPLFEAALRRGVRRFPHVDVRLGHELVHLEQDDEGVRATVKSAQGEPATLRARYLVGADGGKSTVRHEVGVPLTGTTAPVRWLVVDVAEDRMEGLYSAVHCDPVRPVLTIPLPYGHRRFEFKLRGDEDEGDEDAVTRPENIRALLAPLYGSTPLPTILRGRVYLHHSRIADTFTSGRVFLAGDAAHLQPPFFGQGMNSGIRDATNLAWKLAAVVSGRAGERLLETYDTERRGHAAQMVGFATRIGRMYSPWSRLTERLRALVFRAVSRVPGGRDYILQMKYKPMPRYVTGALAADPARPGSHPVGKMFMQPYVETGSGAKAKLDDVTGPWFALVGVRFDPAEVLEPEELAWWQALGGTVVQVDWPRSESRPLNGGARPGRSRGDTGTALVEDVDGAFREWQANRPGDEFFVLRPDRYLAAVSDRLGAGAALRDLRDVLGGPGLDRAH